MDLISRQDAIDAVEFGITYAKAINKSTGEVKELFKEGNKALNEAVERIKDLPSAQPERKKGRWHHCEGMYTCDQCGSSLDDISPFCPMCGADMREDQTDDNRPG